MLPRLARIASEAGSRGGAHNTDSSDRRRRVDAWTRTSTYARLDGGPKSVSQLFGSRFGHPSMHASRIGAHAMMHARRRRPASARDDAALPLMMGAQAEILDTEAAAGPPIHPLAASCCCVAARDDASCCAAASKSLSHCKHKYCFCVPS
jgi:hypothetical protein